MLVILAGYKGDMDRMLETNPGLRSRFAERLHFEDISAEVAAEMMSSKLASRKLPVAADAAEGLLSLAVDLVNMPQFGNGRDVETWCVMTLQELA
eukprot:scaffold64035_cov45-Prasinocladus_malaysianus.AAC.1